MQSLLCKLGVVVYTLHTVLSTYKMHSSSSSTLVKGTTILLPLLGLTSVFRLLTVYVANQNMLVFAVLFAISNSLQVHPSSTWTTLKQRLSCLHSGRDAPWRLGTWGVSPMHPINREEGILSHVYDTLITENTPSMHRTSSLQNWFLSMCACLLDAFGVFDFVAPPLHFCLKVVCKMGGVISRDYGIYKCLLMCYVVLLVAVCSMGWRISGPGICSCTQKLFLI